MKMVFHFFFENWHTERLHYFKDFRSIERDENMLIATNKALQAAKHVFKDNGVMWKMGGITHHLIDCRVKDLVGIGRGVFFEKSNRWDIEQRTRLVSKFAARIHSDHSA